MFYFLKQVCCPFHGIKDDEITTYSELFSIPPPESDDDAFKLGKKIREWIKSGKPNPGESKSVVDDSEVDDVQKHDKEEKSKKKGRFGFFKK